MNLPMLTGNEMPPPLMLGRRFFYVRPAERAAAL